MCREQTFEEHVFQPVGVLAGYLDKTRRTFTDAELVDLCINEVIDETVGDCVNSSDDGRSRVMKITGNIDRITRKAGPTIRHGGNDLIVCNDGRRTVKSIDHVEYATINNGPTVYQK